MYVFHTVPRSILQQTQSTETLKRLFFHSCAVHIHQPVRTSVIRDVSNFANVCAVIINSLNNVNHRHGRLKEIYPGGARSMGDGTTA